MRFQYEVKCEARKLKWGIAGKPTFLVDLLVLYMGIVFWQYLLMGGELGNESNIDVLLGSSATPPPIFALVGKDSFVAKFVLKIMRF